MDFFKMSEKDFYNLPELENDFCFNEFKGIVLLPIDDLHDSGYGCFDIALIGKDNNPIGRVTKGDVLRLYGNPKFLQVDLLPESKLFFVYSYSLKMQMKENLISTKIIEIL